MSILSTLYEQYGFSSIVSDGIEILYSYNKVDPVVSYLDIGYTFTDSSNDNDLATIPLGWKTPTTQKILNNFPMWMELRKDYDSVGNKLASSWGMTLDRIISFYNTTRKDQFLYTADLYHDVNTGVSELSNNKEKIYSSSFRNFLFNSSFSMKAPARYQKPIGWTVSRSNVNNLSFNIEESVFGTSSLKLNGLVTLKQTRELIIPSTPLTLSIFVKTKDTELLTTDTWPASEAGMVLIIKYADASIQTYGVGFPKNTLGKWARASLTVTQSKEINTVSVIISNKREDLSFVVDCPMLESSKNLAEWSPSILDVPLSSTASFRQVTGLQVLINAMDENHVNKIELLPLASEQEFKNYNIPTRILPVHVKSVPGNSINLSLGKQINFHGEVMPTIWKADLNQIIEQSSISPDVFGKHYPADVIMDEQGDKHLDLSLINDSGIKVKAVTVYNDHLYCVTKEIQYGVTRYCLKTVKPVKVSYSDTYLPSIGDIEIPITLGNKFGIDAQDEEIVRIGISKNISDTIFIDTNVGRRFHYKLYYDYFFPDFINRKVYTRENYSAQNGFLQLI